MARNGRKRRDSGSVPKAPDFQPSRRARQIALAHQDAVNGDGRVNLLKAWSIRPGHVKVRDRHGVVVDVANACETIGNYRAAHNRDLWDQREKATKKLQAAAKTAPIIP